MKIGFSATLIFFYSKINLWAICTESKMNANILVMRINEKSEWKDGEEQAPRAKKITSLHK